MINLFVYWLFHNKIIYFYHRYYVSSRLKSTVVVGLADLKRERAKYSVVQKDMVPNDFDTYRWRTSKLIELVERAGPDTRLRLVEWHIMSDNESFFNFNETEFAVCVHKLITPMHTYTCMETHGCLLTSVDIHQDDVGPKDGPPEWVDTLPFYHSEEKCSIGDLQCMNLKSCQENCLNRDPPQVRVTSAPTGSMASFMQHYTHSLQSRMSRSRSQFSTETSTAAARPHSSYITPRMILGRNVPLHASAFQYEQTNFPQPVPFYDYPVAQTPIPHNRSRPAPLAHLVPRFQEILPVSDDDPAFDDLPDLA